jgi:acyl carrier protein
VATPAGVARQPANPAEELLVAIWREVLRLPRVGVDDDFFALGGHSLSATQLVSRVREVFALELPLRQVFATPTPAGLAAALAAAERTGGRQAPPIAPAPRRGDALPLSFAQQRIWLVDRLAGGSSPFYNQSAAVRLRGRLDVAALAATFAEIVRRHEVLRTTYLLRGGRPTQVVAAEAQAPLAGLDLTALPAAAGEEEVRRLALAEARRPFDLAGELPLRLHLLRRGEESHVLLLTLHHIAGDGWSWSVMLREVGALYAAFRAGRPSPLLPLAVQYADYALWQRQWLRGEVLAKHLDFWRRSLTGGWPALALPADRSRSGPMSYRGARQTFRLPADLAGELRGLAGRERATLFMVLFAGFAAFLHRTCRQDDVTVGAAVAGRTRIEVEPLIGCFINLLPLRVSLAGNPSFRELLRRVREVTLGAFAHQELPLELLAAELKWERAAAGAPLVQVAFGVQNTPADAVELPGLSLDPVDFEPGMARFDLTLWIDETADGLAAAWTYSADLFTAPTVATLHERFITALASAVADPEAHLEGLAMVSEREREQQAIQRQDWREAKSERFAAGRARRRRPSATENR